MIIFAHELTQAQANSTAWLLRARRLRRAYTRWATGTQFAYIRCNLTRLHDEFERLHEDARNYADLMVSLWIEQGCKETIPWVE